MLNPHNSSCAIGRVRESLKTEHINSEAPLCPGDKVVVLDMFGIPQEFSARCRKLKSTPLALFGEGTLSQWAGRG
jgi:hypothetical protein